MDSPLPFEISKEKLTKFCEQNHIYRLSLFGSVLRNDFRDDSDVDVLVEFEPGHVPGYKFIEIERKLSTFLDRKSVV